MHFIELSDHADSVECHSHLIHLYINIERVRFQKKKTT